MSKRARRCTGIFIFGHQLAEWLRTDIWHPMPPDAAIGGIPNLARTDWLGLQRVYDWVLALPLSILCVTSRTSARTGASLIRVGASADFRKSIVMEFRTARGNDRKGFEVLRLVGGHRLLLSRGSNRRGFGLRSRDQATVQAKVSGIQ